MCSFVTVKRSYCYDIMILLNAYVVKRRKYKFVQLFILKY